MADPQSFTIDRDLPGLPELLLALPTLEEEGNESQVSGTLPQQPVLSALPEQPQAVALPEQTQAVHHHMQPGQASCSPFAEQLQVLGNNPYSASVLSKWLNLHLEKDHVHQIPLLAVPQNMGSEGGQQQTCSGGSDSRGPDSNDGPGSVKAEPSTAATTCDAMPGAPESSKAKSLPQKRFRCVGGFWGGNGKRHTSKFIPNIFNLSIGCGGPTVLWAHSRCLSSCL